MITIEFTPDQIKQIQADDEKERTFQTFLRLSEDWKLCEVLGFVNYRKIIQQYFNCQK